MTLYTNSIRMLTDDEDELDEWEEPADPEDMVGYGSPPLDSDQRESGWLRSFDSR